MPSREFSRLRYNRENEPFLDPWQRAQDPGIQTRQKEGHRVLRRPVESTVISGHMLSNKRCRFTPNSDHKSGFPQTAMSALPTKADIH